MFFKPASVHLSALVFDLNFIYMWKYHIMNYVNY